LSLCRPVPASSLEKLNNSWTANSSPVGSLFSGSNFPAQLTCSKKVPGEGPPGGGPPQPIIASLLASPSLSSCVDVSHVSSASSESWFPSSRSSLSHSSTAVSSSSEGASLLFVSAECDVSEEILSNNSFIPFTSIKVFLVPTCLLITLASNANNIISLNRL